MHDIELMLTEVLNRLEFRSLTGHYSRNKLISELSSVLEIADSGKISDQTFEHIKGIIYTSIPDNHFLLGACDSKSLAVLMDFFLTEEEFIRLTSNKPSLCSRIINDNPKIITSDLAKSVAAIYL
jgi:hypothetical protein